MTRHLLVCADSIQEWEAALEVSSNRPRLPLPYIFGAAFYKQGHRLSAVTRSLTTNSGAGRSIFEKTYKRHELAKAMKQADFALLWATMGISAISTQVLSLLGFRNVLLASYVWDLKAMPTFKKRLLGWATQRAARYSKGIVVMTGEQEEQARKSLPLLIPVLKCTVGVDTAFYQHAAHFTDVPQEYQADIHNLLKAPYVIMLGDEQRLNEDAIDIAQSAKVNFVRVCQYANSEKMAWLREEINRRALGGRFLIFEKAKYPFLRFLLQNAAAYAGLVDSFWQPAGWTAACECLASGLPVVLYEGLVSRELVRLGAGDFIKVISRGDKRSFGLALDLFCNNKEALRLRKTRQTYSATQLDLEKTGADFVAKFESHFESDHNS